jgi:uncharacterized protein YktA (UPF0223 family)
MNILNLRIKAMDRVSDARAIARLVFLNEFEEYYNKEIDKTKILNWIVSNNYEELKKWMKAKRPTTRELRNQVSKLGISNPQQYNKEQLLEILDEQRKQGSSDKSNCGELCDNPGST